MANRENYGIDAPSVVRTVALVGVALLAFGLLPRSLPGASLAHALWPSGISLLAASLWMLASSLWIKKFVMHSLVNQRTWRGNEIVLDIGCGRGLVTVELARRLPTGTVHGIDIWQQADLSGNGPESIASNAAAAGVRDRLIIDTGDARTLPYPDATFDVITSMTALHNISDPEGRRKAVAEAWRVLKPGGQILIFDIRHARTYLRQLRDLGAIGTVAKGPILLWGPVGWRFTATKPPTRQ